MTLEQSFLIAEIRGLEKEIQEMREYLLLKFHKEDYHGVADAAMDIREIEAELKVYRELARIK